MVEIQVVSDLHLEFPEHYDIFNIPRRAPHLALLGDIGYLKEHEDSYLGFLRRHLLRFQTVFLVLGNHEPWYSSWEATKQVARRFESQIRQERTIKSPRSHHNNPIGEFVFLDQTRYAFPPPPIPSSSSSSEEEEEEEKDSQVIILGCTLFTRVPAESREAVGFGVADFYNTDDWTVEQHSEAFERDLAWLNGQVAKEEEEEGEEKASAGKKKIVILTHHNPTLDPRTVDPRYRDGQGKNSHIQSGFATDLRGEVCWESTRVKVWGFGHTHFNCDFEDERSGKRVLANQKGYYSRKSAGFDDKGVVVRL